MNITSAKYIEAFGENNTIQAVIDGVTKCVPLDPANADYQEILEWVADGNVIAAAQNK